MRNLADISAGQELTREAIVDECQAAGDAVVPRLGPLFLGKPPGFRDRILGVVGCHDVSLSGGVTVQSLIISVPPGATVTAYALGSPLTVHPVMVFTGCPSMTTWPGKHPW